MSEVTESQLDRLVAEQQRSEASTEEGKEICETCEGTGAVDGAECAACEGTGKVAAKRDADLQLECRAQKARDLKGSYEVRNFHTADMEIRQTADGGLRFTGYASTTERAYDIEGFRETVAKGAFKRTLGEGPDVRFKVSHGEGGRLPLARTKSGTLTLTEDARGLRVDADLNPNDPDVQSLLPKMQRGDVDEMSFAFRATDDDWNSDYSERTIRSVSLHNGDVSVVTTGANPDTTGSIAIRSDDGEFEIRAGKALSGAKEKQIKDLANKLAEAGDQLTELLPPEPEPEPVTPWEGLSATPDLTTRAQQDLDLLIARAS